MHSKFLPACLAVFLFLPAAARAQSPKDQGISRDQADAILNELRTIRQMLEKVMRQAAAPQPEAVVKAKLKIEDGNRTLGPKTAPFTIVEFTDYQCPFCRRFRVETYPRLKQELIDTGKVRFVSRDFPLDFHPNAMRAAEAARCADEQGQFWAMHDTLGANAGKLSADDIKGYAGQLKLDLPKFSACVDSDRYKPAIQKDMQEASSLQVGGTPSFVIGKTTLEGVDGILFVGAQPFDAFQAKLKEVGGQ